MEFLRKIKNKFFTKLDRYIISEFWLPLSSGLGIITGVWLGIDKFKEIFRILVKSGSSVDKGIVIIGLEIPEILSLTIPISLLLAAFLTFQKLSGQSELIALRAAGISFLRILRPVALLGLLTTALVFFMSEYVVPVSSPLAKKLYVYALYKNPVPTKSLQGFSYFEKDSKNRIKRIFYVRSMKEQTLKNVIIVDVEKKGLAQIFTASEAEWSPAKGGWTLKKGNSHYIKPDSEEGGPSVNLVSDFDSLFMPSGLNPMRILKKASSFRELNYLQLREFINEHKEGNVETPRLNDALASFHNKFAYPFSCVLLALIGATLGVVGRRKTVNWGYILLGFVVLVYFMSHTLFMSFAETGVMNAFVSVWIPNLILGLIATATVWYRYEN